jgi:hypothetical protein
MLTDDAPQPFSADDDILLVAYPSHTENQDAIDASALQVCKNPTKRVSSC